MAFGTGISSLQSIEGPLRSFFGMGPVELPVSSVFLPFPFPLPPPPPPPACSPPLPGGRPGPPGAPKWPPALEG
eukprot:4473033-Pyramimonas_sp.AAC.1